MIGRDFCAGCGRETLHELEARELPAPAGSGRETVGSIGWTCRTCGNPSPGSLERVVVLLAALGCDPQPRKSVP